MSRIVRIDIGRVDYDVVGTFKFFRPGPDGRVNRPTVLVRIVDDEGVEGFGQAVPVPSWTYETTETVLTTLRFYLAPTLLGADPGDLPGIHERMNTAIRPAFSVGQPLCKAAIDLACHDLLGKRAGRPVHMLLGGERTAPLTLSWTVASPDMNIVEGQLAEGHARGYRNFNIKVSYPQSLDYDLELARKVRAFAPDSFLWADANTGYTTDEALRAAPRLAEVGVDVLESPLPPALIRGYQALRRQGALPILMDEGILSPVETREFIALGMLDGIAMKPARNAGLGPSIEIVRLLQERGLMVLGSGLTDPDLSLAGAIHLFAWAGIDYPCALNGPQFLANSFAIEPFQPTGDQLALSITPGLGLRMDERALAALETVAEA